MAEDNKLTEAQRKVLKLAEKETGENMKKLLLKIAAKPDVAGPFMEGYERQLRKLSHRPARKRKSGPAPR